MDGFAKSGGPLFTPCTLRLGQPLLPLGSLSPTFLELQPATFMQVYLLQYNYALSVEYWAWTLEHGRPNGERIVGQLRSESKALFCKISVQFSGQHDD